MALLVAKFGGTSVGSIEAITHAASHIAREHKEGHQIAAVVSAMGEETDRLATLIRDVATPGCDQREADSALAAGEQVSAALMALALQKQGVPARSWLGWQVPVKTSPDYGRAHIETIETRKLLACLENGEVPVLAGFQGISEDNRITTLGRGGSDASAVALAATLKARRCDIYTDVAGVYSADPRIIPNAALLDKITYEEMLEMASLGARVLQTRAASLAMHHKTRLRIRAATDNPNDVHMGTLVCPEDEIMEKKPVSGIAHSQTEAKITLARVKDRPGVAAAILTPLAQEGILLDMIVQTAANNQRTDITFTLPANDLPRALTILEPLQETIGWDSLASNDKVAKLSVIGIGMRSHTGIAATMFRALADNDINIQAISTSEIKISVLVDQSHMEKGLAVLHEAFITP